MAKKSIKTVAVIAPSSQQQAERLLGDVGRLQRQVVKIEADMNDALATIKEKFERLAQPINEEIESKFHALHIWAEANRYDLLKGKSKTALLATGELQWRRTPPAVKVQKRLIETVIILLKEAGLNDLVRTKEEINKDLILADPARVAGIKAI